jgi:hypothetical protein
MTVGKEVYFLALAMFSPSPGVPTGRRIRRIVVVEIKSPPRTSQRFGTETQATERKEFGIMAGKAKYLMIASMDVDLSMKRPSTRSTITSMFPICARFRVF